MVVEGEELEGEAAEGEEGAEGAAEGEGGAAEGRACRGRRVLTRAPPSPELDRASVADQRLHLGPDGLEVRLEHVASAVAAIALEA